MRSMTVGFAVVLLLAGVVALPSAQTAKPAFDVVSIKPRPFTDQAELRGFASGMGMCGGYRFTPNGNRINLPGTNICSLLRMAFDLTEQQIVAPSWIKDVSPSSFFDIVALGPAGTTLTVEQTRPMLQAMLEERFKLRFHRGTHNAPVYALVVRPQGHKLRTQDIVPCPRTMGNLPVVAIKGMFIGCTPTVSMSQLVFALGREVDRPVVDRTKLTGSYAMALTWAAADPLSGNDTGPSIFTAVKDDLGLSLEPTTEPVEALIVDQIERPSSN
jgi:uncharacterized protein (TIGR03435 family)